MVRSLLPLQTNTQLVMEFLLESRSEPYISVRNHGNFHFVSSYYLSDVDVGQLLGRNALLDRNEMGTLGQLINDKQN